MALTSSSGGPDDNDAQAGHLIPCTTWQKIVRSGKRGPDGSLPPEVWAERDIAATLNLNDLGSESRAVELVVTPLAVRGRRGGSQLEIGEPGEPYNTLRAGNGGSSRSALVAISTTGTIAHTLTGEGHSGGNGIKTQTSVRRLTPLECERLQGFPDGWTATSNGKPQSDSARYRQMGNSVAVPCVEWIVSRIVAEDARDLGDGAESIG